MEMVQDHGIIISPTQIFGPYPGDAAVSAGKYFTPLFQTVTKFTKEIVSAEVNQCSWNELFPTGAENQSCIEAIRARGKFRQEFVKHYLMSSVQESGDLETYF